MKFKISQPSAVSLVKERLGPIADIRTNVEDDERTLVIIQIKN